MKKKAVIKKLKTAGWYLKRQGANHEIWTDGKKSTSVPRHTELDEDTAKGILKDAGIK